MQILIERRIVINKIEQKTSKKDGMDSDKNIPQLNVPGSAISVLQKHLQSYPPSDIEYKESILTGSSIIDTLSSQRENNNTISQNKGSAKGSETDDDLCQALDNITLSSMTNNSKTKTYMHEKYTNTAVDPEQRSIQYHLAQKQKLKHRLYKKTLEGRKLLPAFHFQNQICDVVQNNRVTLISGDTGCGKSVSSNNNNSSKFSNNNQTITSSQI